MLPASTSVLVFPIDMASSVAFATTARELGLNVVVATSEILTQEEINDGVVNLPYITDSKFDNAFANLLKRENIGLVFTPHATVWSYFCALSADNKFPVGFSVCNDSPVVADRKPFDAAYSWAKSCLSPFNISSSEAKASLSLQRYANLYLAYNQIPGQSDDDKLRLLTHIAKQSPSGDVVEIGSYYGRSAFALTWLAKFHSLGTVVCIDPWRPESSEDQGAAARLVNQAGGDLNWDQVFLSFVASLCLFDNINYLRTPSTLALKEYQLAASAGSLSTEEFGTTNLCGSISILHIDGNHKYEEIKQDIHDWVPLVQDGGWVLIDDYLWAFGDGPKRAGDELLQGRTVKTAYVVGDTLCIQL